MPAKKAIREEETHQNCADQPEHTSDERKSRHGAVSETLAPVILAIPVKDASTPVMVDPFLQDGESDEVKDRGGEIEWVVEECCRERDEPDHAKDEGVEGDDDCEDETAFGADSMDVADMEEPA